MAGWPTLTTTYHSEEIMPSEIVEYSKTEAALSDLAARYKGVVFDVTTAEGMKTAKAGRAEIRKYRTSLEDLRKAIKAPALRRCQVIDEEARRITAELVALEDPIDAQIKREEQRKEEERMQAYIAEQKRLKEAEAARKAEEERQLAEERAKLAAERAEMERQKREREEIERQARLKLEADERAARERIEAQEREARQALAKAEAEAKAKRDAEEAALRAEREAIEKAKREQEDRERAERAAIEAKERAARAEQEAKERAAREAQEAEQREIRRKEIEQADARAMLELFKKRYGHLPQYAGVVAAINAALKEKVAA
jgi:hypothetical protein